MPIMVIKGPPKSGKSTIANALRNAHIDKKCGALLVDETNLDAAPWHLIEKLIVGMPISLPNGRPLPVMPKVENIPWKRDPLVILVGNEAEKMLAVFEDMLPGFTAMCGPISRLNTEKVK